MTRSDIISVLKVKSMTAVDLSIEFGRSVPAIEEDLDHIRTTLRNDPDYKLLMHPAICSLCGYQFSTTKVKSPTKCPECHREKINLPHFKIERK